jgi:hypothetical protein
VNDVVSSHSQKTLGYPKYNDFHLPLTYLQEIMEPTSIFLVRYNGQWVKIHSRPFEPERMTTDVAWIQIKEDVDPEEAYRRWFEKQRRISRVLK